MNEVIARSKSHLANMLDGDVNIYCNNPVRVVNTLLMNRKEIVRFSIHGSFTVKILDAEGLEIPALCIPSWENADCKDVFFTACVPALWE